MAEATDRDPADGVAELLAELIRFDTTNRARDDAAGEREAAERVAALLADEVGVAPVVLESAPRRANVVARIPGTEPGPALLVHAHLDVVPADPAAWTVPPFAGEIRDGFVWGRGATDMKDTCAAVLSAVRGWRDRGLSPRRDLVLAFVADEETGGEYGAQWLVREHRELFAGCAAAVGESGGFPLVAGGRRIYPIGTAERGTLHLRLTARGRAGHGSRPNPDNAVVTLVEALARVAAHRWPLRSTPAVAAYLTGCGAALDVPVDLTDDAAVAASLARLGPAARLATATLRTSATPTGLRTRGVGGMGAVNVIPDRAQAQLDVRVLPGTLDETTVTLRELLGPRIHTEVISQGDPVAAPLEHPVLAAATAALLAHDPTAAVVPYCLGGGTDAKAFAAGLGIACYGFAPLGPPADAGGPDAAGYDFRAQAHGVDERVPVAALEFGARVLDRFLREVASG